MKVSIITVAYNSRSTIKDTIDSVLKQTYGNIEYIIVDGASTDDTAGIVKSYGKNIDVFISEPDKGLYDAINKGILAATGDVIGILNSDDFFASPFIIERIVLHFKNPNLDALFADVAFVSPVNLGKIVRLYSSKKFTPQKFAKGFMPAHPSFYVKRSMYLQYGLYKTNFKIAADYELLIRLLYTHKIKAVYINEVFVYMRTGGVSNKNFYSIYLLNREIVKACRENNIHTNMAILSLKYFTKIFEYLLPAKKSKTT